MPELPEVQTVVNDLKNHILGKTIYSVEILWPKTIHTPIATDFAADLKNAKIENITRRGKFIVIKVASKSTRHSLRVTRYWLTHLRMTGQFRVHDDAKLNTNIDKDIKHLRVKIHFTDGSELIFIDSRKFARMYLVEAVDAITGKLGIEPLEIELKEFQKRVKSSKRSIKPLLLDQSFLSGIGNIYADESLYYAQIHPETASDKLTPSRLEKLHTGIRHVLNKGIALNGASFDQHYQRINGQSGNYQAEFLVYGQKGKPCHRCQTPIKKIIVAQRGTHFCPNCQKS